MKSGSKKPPKSSGKQQQAASGSGGQYGEGNYAATRQYNSGVKKHMEEHDIEKEARDAKPRTASEESDMLAAEREGKRRAKGEEDSLGGPDE
jgi:hypothetical protein